MRYGQDAKILLLEHINLTEEKSHMADVVLYFLLDRASSVRKFEEKFVLGEGEGVDWVELRLFQRDELVSDYVDIDACSNALPTKVYPAGSVIAITYSPDEDGACSWTIARSQEYRDLLVRVFNKALELNLLIENSDINELNSLIRRIEKDGDTHN